jgi:DNA-binding NarL/FixJ family response regulator
MSLSGGGSGSSRQVRSCPAILEKLDDRLQQIFIWKLEGRTNAEIARMISRTERTVELKLQIIRKLLGQEPDARA